MITFVQCVKAQSDLSIPEFRKRWRAYGDTARTLAEATGAVGVSVNTTLAVAENLRVRLSRGTSEPYDGMLRVSWPNAASLEETLKNPAVAAMLEAFQREQESFMDLDRSSFFFASEEALHSATQP
jgi:hypothetical protein